MWGLSLFFLTGQESRDANHACIIFLVYQTCTKHLVSLYTTEGIKSKQQQVGIGNLQPKGWIKDILFGWLDILLEIL